MERNTVTLDLNEYNKLKKFKEKMEEDYTCKIEYDPYYSGDTITYITYEKAVMEVSETNKKLFEENKKLRKEINTYKRTALNKDKILNMNWWDFIQFKKTLKKTHI